MTGHPCFVDLSAMLSPSCALSELLFSVERFLPSSMTVDFAAYYDRVRAHLVLNQKLSLIISDSIVSKNCCLSLGRAIAR
jgi:hypothetical protein